MTLVSKKHISSISIFFIIILLSGLLLRISTALFFENMLWPDEIYQTLEQAHRIVFGVGIIPWEFRDGIRSFIFPGFIAMILYPFRFFTINSSLCYIAFVKIVFCVFSCSLILFAYLYAKQLGIKYASILAAFFISFWHGLIYFSPKALSEVFACYLILPGLFFIEKLLINRNVKDAVIGGILLGLGISFRIQYIILWVIPLLFIVFYDFKARNYNPLFAYLAASLTVIVLSGILDKITWGGFFHSYIAYINISLVKGISAKWGTMPFWWYLKILWNNMEWLLLFFLICTMFAFYKNKLLITSFLAIFFLHSLIPHKQYRYIFIIFPLLSITSAVGIDVLIGKIPKQFMQRVIILLIVTIFLFTSFMLGQNYTLERAGYFRYSPLGQQSVWTAFQENFLVYRFLSSVPDIWGLQDNVSDWYFSAGYYYLHKNIPIYTINNLNQGEILKNRFANYLITKQLIVRDGLKFVKNISGINIYRKDFIKEREIDTQYNTNR